MTGGAAGGRVSRCPESGSGQRDSGTPRGTRMGPGSPGLHGVGWQAANCPLCPLPRWLAKLFQNQIESRFQKVLNSKVRSSTPRGVRRVTQGWADILTDHWPSVEPWALVQTYLVPRPREDKPFPSGHRAGVWQSWGHKCVQLGREWLDGRPKVKWQRPTEMPTVPLPGPVPCPALPCLPQGPKRRSLLRFLQTQGR